MLSESLDMSQRSSSDMTEFFDFQRPSIQVSYIFDNAAFASSDQYLRR